MAAGIQRQHCHDQPSCTARASRAGPAERLGTLAHVQHADTAASPGPPGGLHSQLGLISLHLQSHCRSSAARVLHRVGQSLLENPVEREPGGGRQPADVSLDGERGVGARRPELLDQDRQRAGVGQRRGATVVPVLM